MLVLSTIVILFKLQAPSIRQVGYFWDYPRITVTDTYYLPEFLHFLLNHPVHVVQKYRLINSTAFVGTILAAMYRWKLTFIVLSGVRCVVYAVWCAVFGV
jgi:hypothetical protein